MIPEGITWGSVKFKFRVPPIPNTNTGVITSIPAKGYILWTLASSGTSLFASGELNIFDDTMINDTDQDISGKNGTTNSGSLAIF